MAELHPEVVKYLKARNRKGGRALLKKYGRKHFVEMGRKKRGKVAELAEREGISRQAAWYRIHRATGKPNGRPRKGQSEQKAKR